MPNPHWQGLTKLILVAGHAVYVGDDFDHPADDGNWYLQPFQRGEPSFYIEHIRKGVELADLDETSLLVFSGGQTRYEAGPRSEAQSYWLIANHFSWWWRTNVSLRATTEEFARDSFENLLFGICRFYECVQKYPEAVTVVTWAFKHDRFAMHRDAIGLSTASFVFRGVNNPVDLAGSVKGEQDNALGPFRADPYGTGAVVFTKPDGKTVNLGQKRRERNPLNRTVPYVLSCPELVDLLQHKGPELYSGRLPWRS